MTITEQYIEKIVPYLASAEGAEVKITQKNGGNAYEFPCPFCSHLTTSSGKQKPKKKTAILSPRYESKWVYFFSCRRGYSPECRGGARSFHNFLACYDQSLFHKYLRDMEHNKPMKQS